MMRDRSTTKVEIVATSRSTGGRKHNGGRFATPARDRLNQGSISILFWTGEINGSSDPGRSMAKSIKPFPTARKKQKDLPPRPLNPKPGLAYTRLPDKQTVSGSMSRTRNLEGTRDATRRL